MALGFPSGDVISVRGLSPGTAVVTVTATDPDELTANIRVEVLVPNRPPVINSRIPAVAILQNGLARLDLEVHFGEPDGQELSYTATSSDVDVAVPSVSNPNLAIDAGAAGIATVTVTASDPGGLTTSQDVPVTVAEAVTLFRDDFESHRSLNDWRVPAPGL